MSKKKDVVETTPETKPEEQLVDRAIVEEVAKEMVQEALPPEPQVSDAELLRRVRQFNVTLEDGTIRKAEIRLLTPEQAREAEEYALSVVQEKAKGTVNSVTGKVIKLPTRDNMMEDAREKGLWTDDDEIQYTTLDALLRKKTEEMRAGKMKKSDAHRLFLEIVQIRKDILPYYRTRYNIYDRTADAAGEDALNKYMCVVQAVWVDTEEQIFPDFKSFDNGGMLRRQVFEFWRFLQDLSQEVNAPQGIEMVFARKFGFLDKDDNVYACDPKTGLPDKNNIIMNLRDPVEEGDAWEFFEEDGETIAAPYTVTEEVTEEPVEEENTEDEVF